MVTLYNISPVQYGTNQERIRQQEQRENTTEKTNNQ